MPDKRKVYAYSFFILVILAISYFVYKYKTTLWKILIPFLIALIISYTLHPLVEKFERKGISRNIAILILYLFFILISTTVFLFVIPELINNTRELSSTLPDIIGDYQKKFNGFISIIQSSNWPSDIKNSINIEIGRGAEIIQNYIMGVMRKSLLILIDTLNTFFDIFLSLIIAYYFIKDAEYFRELALSLVPGKWRSGLTGTGREVNTILANFIQGQLLTALIVGVLETAGLLIIRVKYPLILGLIG